MNRRDALRRTALLMGSAISASAMTGLLSGCQPDKSISWKPAYFSPEEGDIVMHITERIIPKTTTPGANDAGVHTFIDKMMAEFYGDKEKKAFKDGLKRVAADSDSDYHKDFTSLTPEQQDALLKKYDQEAFDQSKTEGSDPHFFRTMKELTLLGFFSSEIGATEVLRYEPSPGAYNGCIPYAKGDRAWATS